MTQRAQDLCPCPLQQKMRGRRGDLWQLPRVQVHHASIGPEHAVRLSHATRQFASDTGLTRDDLLTLPAQDILASRVFNTQTPQET